MTSLPTAPHIPVDISQAKQAACNITDQPEIPSAETQAERMLKDLETSRLIYDAWASKFGEQYKIRGKSIEDWKDHFYIQVPPDLNMKTCQEIDIKLMALFQEAAFYKGEAEASLKLQKGGHAKRFRVTYTRLVKEYASKGKLPAKDTLVTLADNELGDIKDSILHGETVVDFWREVLANLANCRKIIENATLNISVELKFHNRDPYVPREETHE